MSANAPLARRPPVENDTPPAPCCGAPPEWLDTSMYPFRSRFMTVEGCRLHYVDEGTGIPLVLLHGNPTWSFLYRDVIAELRSDFRCLAPDYPGFGLSAAAEGYGYTPAEHAGIVEAWLRELGVSGAILLVHDWGGPIGLFAAARKAGVVRALVIGNSFAWPLDGQLRYELFSRFWGSGVGRYLCRRFNAFVNVLLPLGTNRGRPGPRVMDAYRGPFPDPGSRVPTHVFPRELLRSRRFLTRVEGGLSRLADLPALLLWGDADPAFRGPQLRRFQQLLPENRTVLLEDAGHFIQEDAPREMCAEIRRWWRETTDRE